MEKTSIWFSRRITKLTNHEDAIVHILLLLIDNSKMCFGRHQYCIKYLWYCIRNCPVWFLSYFYFHNFASIPTFLHVYPFDSPIDPLASSYLSGLSGNIDDPPTSYGLAISRLLEIIFKLNCYTWRLFL